MSEKELVESIILERIEFALANLERSNITTDEENKKILEAERILDNLPENERFYINLYIDNFIKDLTTKEVCLYKEGFNDGVKTMKAIINI